MKTESTVTTYTCDHCGVTSTDLTGSEDWITITGMGTDISITDSEGVSQTGTISGRKDFHELACLTAYIAGIKAGNLL